MSTDSADDLHATLRDPAAALEHELACHYHADEHDVTEAQFLRDVLPRLGNASARRLILHVGPEHAPELVSLLEALRADARHPLFRRLNDAAQFSWNDEDDWAAFLAIAETLITELRRAMAGSAESA